MKIREYIAYELLDKSGFYSDVAYILARNNIAKYCIYAFDTGDDMIDEYYIYYRNNLNEIAEINNGGELLRHIMSRYKIPYKEAIDMPMDIAISLAK